TVNSATS
ncbi:sodium/hydrogen exchanger family protein, partial [Vibrio parahaemolyticus V-223/04]